MHAKPVLDNKIPELKKPILDKNIKGQINWSFSFRYFKQIKYFGLAESPTKWFISVFERLKDLGNEEIDTFFTDHRKKDANRYHQINWSANKIPIKKEELNWIPKAYLENDEDYPFFQFQVSTGLGRIIGFWKEDYSVFFIVLMDSKHNLQPSRNYNYQVDDTNVLPSEYASLLCDVDELKGLMCKDINCKCRNKLLILPTKINRTNFVYFHMEDDYYQSFMEATKNKSLKEIIELGLLNFN